MNNYNKFEPSVTLEDCMGTDLTVVNAARVSFDKKSEWDPNERNPHPIVFNDGTDIDSRVLLDKDKSLIKYLASHNHWTPFGHVSLQFVVTETFAIARQLGKHQVGLVWNEVSRRYVSYPLEMFMPQSWRAASKNKKQGSSEKEVTHLLDGRSVEYAVSDLYARASDLYDLMIQSGVCPEQARFVAPMGAKTEWYWTGSLAAFARVVNLRKDSHAQLEVQQFASRIDSLIPSRMRESWNALVNSDTSDIKDEICLTPATGRSSG